LHQAFSHRVRGLVGAAVVFPLAERIEGRAIRARQRQLATHMALPFAERRRRAFASLVETVRFAGAHVPYYRDLFRSRQFDPECLARDPRHLDDLPMLTKDIIRAEGERMLRDDHAAFRKHVCKTGGSTGPSAHIIYDQDGADAASALTRQARALIGAGAVRAELHLSTEFGDRPVLRDRLREQMKCIANNRFNLAFASFAPAELDRLWARITALRPYLIHGHPSTLYQLARHVSPRRPAAPAFAIFESSGEMLTATQRALIERVFRCRVVDRYGLAEAGVLAYQTGAAEDGLLVFDQAGWPEIAEVAFGGELASTPGARSGELVVTALGNRMMPLIRYRTGDLATLVETAKGFYLRDLVGRIHDVVSIAGVPQPTHRLQDVLDRIGGIREFQIEARAARPLFRIVAEDGARERIDAALRRQWADAIDIEFIDAEALTLQGWRAKFRHLVTPDAVMT